MAQNTSLIFIPGICSVASIVYAPLIDHLSSKHKISKSSLIPVNLPSCDAIASKASLKPSALDADIKTIRTAITTQLDLGHDILLIAHSYGGTPSLCAADGLWKAQRLGLGIPNGIIHIALLTSSLPLPGKTIAGDRQFWKEEHPEGGISEEGAGIEQHGDEYFIIPETLGERWMPDIATENALRKSLRPSPLSVAMTPTPQLDMRSWNLSYLVTTDLDEAMPEAFQMWLIERAREAGVAIEDVKKIKSGHFVQASHADEVGEWVVAMMR